MQFKGKVLSKMKCNYVDVEQHLHWFLLINIVCIISQMCTLLCKKYWDFDIWQYNIVKIYIFSKWFQDTIITLIHLRYFWKKMLGKCAHIQCTMLTFIPGFMETCQKHNFICKENVMWLYCNLGGVPRLVLAWNLEF